MSELKPCPFCGSAFKMGQEPNDNHPVAGRFYIYHDYGPIGSAARTCRLDIGGHFETAEEAETFWNTRAGEPVNPSTPSTTCRHGVHVGTVCEECTFYGKG